jgi:RNA polymerase Rpb1, domain 7
LQIEYTTLGDITVKTEIHYDPDASTTVIEEDKEFVDEYLLLEGTFVRTCLFFVLFDS